MRMSTSEVIGRPQATATDPSPPGKHIPGEAGIWVLLFGDMLVFAVLFVVYLSRRGEDRELFAQSQDALNRNFGAINTLVLLTSSVFVVFAVVALRSERWRSLAPRLTIVGFAIGCLFVVVKIFEYHEKIAAGITPSTNEFFMYYYVLTGLHLAHVVIGLGVLVALSVLARKPSPTPTRIAFFEGGGCFWHMVDLLWIVIFPLLFLVR
ncbi:cytochrome c oxidase subunit III [Mycolicibacterium pulveris]|uniref:Probable cytochrome c oxidase subunit 3 n=2 Tax=Mycolicibacterium pulveris TaxID=36813 RepID=A0A7I7UG48_MYCPV|nr:cytochrome c oxidase subunit III [Mycolicibacterium pulveris]